MSKESTEVWRGNTRRFCISQVPITARVPVKLYQSVPWGPTISMKPISLSLPLSCTYSCCLETALGRVYKRAKCNSWRQHVCHWIHRRSSWRCSTNKDYKGDRKVLTSCQNTRPLHPKAVDFVMRTGTMTRINTLLRHQTSVKEVTNMSEQTRSTWAKCFNKRRLLLT